VVIKAYSMILMKNIKATHTLQLIILVNSNSFFEKAFDMRN